MRNCASLLCFVMAFVAPGITASELLKTRSSWDGGSFSYPPGKAEVTAVVLALDENQITPFHCHPVPTMGFVLEGSIEVETAQGDKTLLEQGAPVVEVMRTLHRGKAVNGAVKIVVFYAGSTAMPNTVLAGDEASGRYCTGKVTE
ncbi:MAG: cupin domain-containing protein [Halieaceae bacterium]|jgi:quercetin dioxygenase-like cupin family protein|nr:cupin domain-containing protein [Halieaceae bacterium]